MDKEEYLCSKIAGNLIFGYSRKCLLDNGKANKCIGTFEIKILQANAKIEEAIKGVVNHGKYGCVLTDEDVIETWHFAVQLQLIPLGTLLLDYVGVDEKLLPRLWQVTRMEHKLEELFLTKTANLMIECPNFAATFPQSIGEALASKLLVKITSQLQKKALENCGTGNYQRKKRYSEYQS
ncbi:hypothetical protein F5884DRAFT_757646 [Xylogone sp. PMI_703]|nr:hypothetical protein F5884DRAFT_757646 [Xylogone sp. PMI_703]